SWAPRPEAITGIAATETRATTDRILRVFGISTSPLLMMVAILGLRRTSRLAIQFSVVESVVAVPAATCSISWTQPSTRKGAFLSVTTMDEAMRAALMEA